MYLNDFLRIIQLFYMSGADAIDGADAIAAIQKSTARTQYIASLPVPKHDHAGGQGFRDPDQPLIR